MYSEVVRRFSNMEMYLCGLLVCMCMCVHKILLLDLGGPVAVILAASSSYPNYLSSPV